MDARQTLSGQTVTVEQVLWENPNLAEERGKNTALHSCGQVTVPLGHRLGGVPERTYTAYRLGLDSACADIVICTRLEDGTPAVLAAKRLKEKPFGGYWWMQGGAIHAYQPIIEGVVEKAEQECGARPKVEGLIGFYRTCAEGEHVASTIQPCYVGSVPLAQARKARLDQDHSAWKLLTLKDLENLPEKERHWYPTRLFRLALQTMPPIHI